MTLQMQRLFSSLIFLSFRLHFVQNLNLNLSILSSFFSSLIYFASYFFLNSKTILINFWSCIQHPGFPFWFFFSMGIFCFKKKQKIESNRRTWAKMAPVVLHLFPSPFIKYLVDKKVQHILLSIIRMMYLNKVVNKCTMQFA